MSPATRRVARWLCAPWLHAAGPQATAVVDRIESDFLVVEWADGTIGDLPARWWAGARPAREGERVVASLRPARRGLRALTGFPVTFSFDSGTVQLPVPALPGRPYAVCARPFPRPPRVVSPGESR